MSGAVEQEYTYSNVKSKSQRSMDKEQRKIDKMNRARDRRESGKLRKVPVLGSVIRAVTFEFPKSVSDAIVIDIVQGAISIIPIIGDLVIDVPRTFRYSIDSEIPSSVRGKVVAISVGDAAFGIVPGVGDVIDLAFLSNTFSYGIVQKARGERLNFFRRRKVPIKPKEYAKEQTASSVIETRAEVGRERRYNQLDDFADNIEIGD